jgi:hypothetical protein
VSSPLDKLQSFDETRMNRLEDIKITPDNAQSLKSKNEYIWMVISEGWCGDGAQLIPVLIKWLLSLMVK